MCRERGPLLHEWDKEPPEGMGTPSSVVHRHTSSRSAEFCEEAAGYWAQQGVQEGWRA